MKKNNYYRKLIVGIVILFVGMGIAPGITNTLADDSFETHVETIEFIQEFSKPIIRENEEFVEIIVDEANSCMAYEKKPMMPFLSKTYEFPLGTKLINVEITPSKIKTMAIGKQVKPAPPKQKISHRMITVEKTINQEIYSNSEPYPNEWCSYNTGAGLSKDNEHVLFLSLHLYPTRYLPLENSIQYVEQIMVSITYEEPETEPTNSDGYNLVIISPSEFSNNLQPLVDHKNSYNMETNLVTLDDIYGEFPGRDDAEQIKYFIKHAIEEWDIEYVLLVGDIKKLPIRTTYAAQWGEGIILSDLYFADVYDENMSFCSWDGNNNSKFGEVYYDQHHMYDLDGVDLYADVHLGRLACTNQFEVSLVVKKIINYETITYGSDWFNRMVLCGGDTFPFHNGIEGEITNDVIADYCPDFTHIRLWCSQGTYNWINLNREVNKGAGFVEYSGHGFEIGMSTHPPDDELWIKYRNRHLFGLFNRNKLPIVFFDACLTSTLDFDLSGLIWYTIGREPNNPVFHSILIPTYSWNWITMPYGGAIATVGATREAYTNVHDQGVFGGAGLLSVNFFRAYEEGIMVSQMLTQSQNDYIDEAGKDFFTLEEFVLLGDPSLRVGGYPPN